MVEQVHVLPLPDDQHEVGQRGGDPATPLLVELVKLAGAVGAVF